MFRKGCANTYLRPMSYFFLFITIIVTMVSYCTSSWYFKVESYTVIDDNIIQNENEIIDTTDKQLKNYTLHKGIWNVCEDWISGCVFLPDESETFRFDISSDALTTVRALFSMSVMLMFGALGYPPFYKNMSSGVLKIGIMSILTAAAGICTFASMLIMTHAIHSLEGIDNIRIGYSYIAGWASVGMSFFTASLLYIASKDNVYVEGLY